MLRSVRATPAASNILAASRTVKLWFSLRSEAFGTFPNRAESFRTVPNDSEAFGTVRKLSEPFRTLPDSSEVCGIVPGLFCEF